MYRDCYVIAVAGCVVCAGGRFLCAGIHRTSHRLFGPGIPSRLFAGKLCIISDVAVIVEDTGDSYTTQISLLCLQIESVKFSGSALCFYRVPA